METENLGGIPEEKFRDIESKIKNGLTLLEACGGSVAMACDYLCQGKDGDTKAEKASERAKAKARKDEERAEKASERAKAKARKEEEKAKAKLERAEKRARAKKERNLGTGVDVRVVREAVQARLNASAGDSLEDKVNTALSVGAAYAATVGEDHHAVPVWREIVKLHPRFQSGSADSVDWELIWEKILKNASEKLIPFDPVEAGDEEVGNDDTSENLGGIPEENLSIELKS
jgi:pyruvate/2-oxoglutarate dehydrogenase complex dihydrolipoamide acyltransferase (E2) component